MGETGEYWKEHREYRKSQRSLHGNDCLGCKANYPNRIPTLLMPGQTCRVCGYKRERKTDKKKGNK
jgi:hypothetical protein